MYIYIWQCVICYVGQKRRKLPPFTARDLRIMVLTEDHKPGRRSWSWKKIMILEEDHDPGRPSWSVQIIRSWQILMILTENDALGPKSWCPIMIKSASRFGGISGSVWDDFGVVSGPFWDRKSCSKGGQNQSWTKDSLPYIQKSEEKKMRPQRHQNPRKKKCAHNGTPLLAKKSRNNLIFTFILLIYYSAYYK